MIFTEEILLLWFIFTGACLSCLRQAVYRIIFSIALRGEILVEVYLRILVSKHSGFCFGVRRAVDMTVNEAGCGEGCVYTLGPIIHNSFVVDNLASNGVVAVNELSDVKEGDTIVIRSHGVPECVYKEAQDRGLKIVDATCPFVKKIHELVYKYSGDGYTIIIVGKADHPEVIGIKGWSQGDTYIVYSLSDIEKIPFNEIDKICVVAQTTVDIKHFKCLTAELLRHMPGARIFDTVCLATNQRQSAAEKLAKVADMMVVVGDEKSSNTKRLYELCKNYCNNTCAVQSAADVINICDGVENVGIVAGASTPDWVIKEVISRMTEEQKVTEVAEVAAEEIAKDVAEEATMEDFEKSMVKLRNGQYVKGIVISATDDAVYVNLGYKADGIIPKSEYKLEEGQKLQDVVSEGDEVEVEVVQVNDGDGNVILSRKPVLERAAWGKVIDIKENEEVVTVKVKEAVKGGVLATYGQFRVFIPASQLGIHFVKNIEAFVGKELEVKFIDVNVRAKRVVASRKIVAMEERQKQEDEFWATHKVGDIVKGKVKSVTTFGAFVDLGAFDGLIHISVLTWDDVQNVADVVNVGDEVEAKITELDVENKRISLNRRVMLAHPWESVSERIKEGDVMPARVIRILDFAAIVSLEPHIEGIMHISQISRKRIEKVEDAVKIGDEFEVKIVSVDPEKRRINVSKRALEAKPERPHFEKKPKDEGESPARKKKVPRFERQEAPSMYMKEDMKINLGDFFPQEMLDEIREAEKN